MRKDLYRYRGALLKRERWLDLGMHSRDLAGPDFTTVFRGWHTPTDHPATFHATTRRLQQSILPGAVLSHSTAALLWGIPLPAQLEGGVGLLGAGMPELGSTIRLPDYTVGLIPSVLPGESLRAGAKLPILHCRVPQGSSSGSRRGLAVHRWEPGPTEQLDGRLLSSRAEVLRELATVLPIWDVVAAIDAVVGPKSRCPGLDLDDLRAHSTAMRGRRGNARLRAALPLARSNSWSPGETIMRLLICSAGFPEPALNHPVSDASRGQIRYLDLAWPHCMFALEYDGDVHRTKQQWREDEARRDELASQGWSLARANGDDLWTPLRILQRLSRSLHERGLAVPTESQVKRFVASLSTARPSLRIARQQPYGRVAVKGAGA